jgi:multiple antibiotic resistance protein
LEIVGISIGEWVAILFIGLGPVRVTLAYTTITRSLPADAQRKLAWRTVLVGGLFAVLVLLIGGGIARQFAVRQEVLLIAAGVAFASRAFSMLSATPTDMPEPPKITDPMRLAISPLALPIMISPVGVVALFIVAMEGPGLGESLAFVALVAGILALNLGAMLLSRHIARYITMPVLELVQQVFGILILALSARLVLEALEGLGLVTISGNL